MTGASKAVAILAGGQSRRMGQDKATLPLGGKPIIQHVIQRVRALNVPVVLIVREPGQHAEVDLTTHADIYPGQGAVGGIYTALKRTGVDNVLVTACDMPLLNVRLLSWMMGQASGDGDAVVPYVLGRWQPLLAVYHASALNVLEASLHEQDLRMRHVLTRLNVQTLPESELIAFDPQLLSFHNANTPEDYEQIQTLYAQQQDDT